MHTFPISNLYIVVTSLIHFHQIVQNIIPFLQIIIQFFFSYNLYIIDNKEIKTKIMKNMKKNICFCYDENKEPLRLVIHNALFPAYIAYVTESNYDSRLWIFTRKNTLNTLMYDQYTKKEIELDKQCIPSNKSKEDSLESDSISYLSFSGGYGNFFINERQIDLKNQHSHLEWYDCQQTLFFNIMQFYKKNNYCKIYLSGNPGKGKTFFAYLMAQKLNCYLTDEYDPTDPGSSLDTLYHRARKVSPNKPLIMVLDEADILLTKIHNEQIPKHKHYKSEIYNKATWNQFLDKVGFGLYPYMIVLLISNKDKKNIDCMDSAYLRRGRINIYEEW